ncbi:DUF1652 domain-containing protein [Pseudomonas sp. GV071]|jgi:hypothetical protein|uniref:DUF1652 domain-containing protein n=1 Tax=Pseudomonas sp. GV071 TaxID=2135754 RepID=UPI000D44F169|nr:DUF1652 domain-containing protein [Pseudomonas sp. GV071]PTQ70590.1 uncharacterized protein DUF1652 [Pseudomonas sp. GV071]
MAKMTFPYACARLKEYFYPMGFEAVLDSPSTMTARVFDSKTGEDLAVLAGLAWGPSTTEADLVDITELLDQEMHAQEFVHVPMKSDSITDG